jgi:hypothetical protein
MPTSSFVGSSAATYRLSRTTCLKYRCTSHQSCVLSHRATYREVRHGLNYSITMAATFIQNIFVAFPLFSNAETAHPTTGGPEGPVYFYESNKPYFELAQLSLASRLSPLTLHHQVHKLLRPSGRIPRLGLSDRGAPYAFFHRKASRVMNNIMRSLRSFSSVQVHRLRSFPRGAHSEAADSPNGSTRGKETGASTTP